jgi:hypothetical protein
MIENNFFPATKPMGYLLNANAFRKRLITTIPCKLDSAQNSRPTSGTNTRSPVPENPSKSDQPP